MGKLLADQFATSGSGKATGGAQASPGHGHGERLLFLKNNVNAKWTPMVRHPSKVSILWGLPDAGEVQKRQCTDAVQPKVSHNEVCGVPRPAAGIVSFKSFGWLV